MPCGPIFPDQARIGLEVFNSLRAVGVPNPDNELGEDGRQVPPTYGQICRPWITEIAEVIHGAYDVETGERLIREALIKVPKKNWKSGVVAGLALSLMVLNWRQSNEAAVIAPTKETADNVFKPMRDAIAADPELEALFHIQPNIRTITHRVTGISCRVYAADTDTVAGKVWAFVFFEELWLLAQRKGAADLFIEATGGQASRPEGVVISITTESDDESVGVYAEKLEFARKVRDGEIVAPHFLPLLYEWPEDMLKAKAYLKPDNFPLVNPNWGASVDVADFHRKYDEAMVAGGETKKLFLAKRLNVPPSENIGGSWAGASVWGRQGDPKVTLDFILDRCEVCTVGIDGGGLDDLFGLFVLGRDRETRRLYGWAKAWAHRIVLERRKSIAEQLETFDKQGALKLVDSMKEATYEAAALVLKVRDAGLLPEEGGVGIDPAAAKGVLDGLDQVGIVEPQRVGVSQGWRLTSAIKSAEVALSDGELVHGAQPLMAWCVGNAKAEPKGNATMISKQVSGSAKIDPLMAMFNAVELMGRNPEAPREQQFQVFVYG